MERTRTPMAKLGEPQQWFTFNEVSELSGLSRSTLYGYNREGRFENVIQIGKRQQWISREDVERLIGLNPETGEKVDLQSA